MTTGIEKIGLLYLGLLVGWSTGCEQGGCAVGGRITLDGKPLSNGLISLRSAARLASDRSVSADVEDGRFSFAQSQGIKPGKYIVSITAWRKTGRKLAVDDVQDLEEHVQYVPDEYNSTSKLSLDVLGNSSDLLYELTMPQVQPSDALPPIDDESMEADEAVAGEQ